MPGQSPPTLSPNPLTRNNTLLLIHTVFLASIYAASSPIDFLRKFLANLEAQQGIPEEDQVFWGIFIDGVRHCLRLHEYIDMLAESANNVFLTIKYIIEWLNATKFKDSPVQVQLFLRRKAIFSHLMKVLKKSLKRDFQLRSNDPDIEDLSASIHDFLGMLIIVLGEFDSSLDRHPHLNEIEKTVRNILGGLDPQSKNAFLDWLEQANCNPSSKYIIHTVLSTPFKPTRYKNFANNPKPNGYRSIQWVLAEAEYSFITPGSELEIQCRDSAMHYIALFGSASHLGYKNLIDFAGEFKDPEFNGLNLEILINVFVIDDFSLVHIPGFTNYKSDYNPVSIEKLSLDPSDLTCDSDVFGFQLPKPIVSYPY